MVACGSLRGYTALPAAAAWWLLMWSKGRLWLWQKWPASVVAAAVASRCACGYGWAKSDLPAAQVLWLRLWLCSWHGCDWMALALAAANGSLWYVRVACSRHVSNLVLYQY